MVLDILQCTEHTLTPRSIGPQMLVVPRLRTLVYREPHKPDCQHRREPVRRLRSREGQ